MSEQEKFAAFCVCRMLNNHKKSFSDSRIVKGNWRLLPDFNEAVEEKP